MVVVDKNYQKTSYKQFPIDYKHKIQIQNEVNRDLKLKGQVTLSADKNKDITCLK